MFLMPLEAQNFLVRSSGFLNLFLGLQNAGRIFFIFFFQASSVNGYLFDTQISSDQHE